VTSDEPGDPTGPGEHGSSESGNTIPTEHGSEEEVDESVEESFPASDPGQFWAGGPAEDDRVPHDADPDA
jgi:hypothetical protein